MNPGQAAAHRANLRRAVAGFLALQDGRAPFSRLVRHILFCGFNLMDEGMFRDWVRAEFPDARIDYER